MRTGEPRGTGRGPGRGGAVLPLLLALVLALAGCSLVPMGGNPVPGEEAGSGDSLSRPFYRKIAPSPKPGGTPIEILKGFQAAMAGDDDSRVVARSYLTGEAARTWNPWAGVTVYDQEKQIRVVTSPDDENVTRLVLEANVVATVDDDGRYRPAVGDMEDKDPEDKTFTLVKTPQGWRISSAPPGLLLSLDDFRRIYRPLDLYFPDQQMSGLVVDRVQIPVSPRETLIESLLERLLQGPTSALGSAVRSAIPVGTRLNRVTAAEQGTLVVDFSAEILSARSSETVQRAMEAQLAWTLRGLASGRTVEVLVNGEPWPGGGLRIELDRYAGYDPNVLGQQPEAYFMRNGRLHRLTWNGDPGVAPGVAGKKTRAVRRPAISGNANTYVAALGDDGIYVAPLADEGEWQRWVRGRDLTPPSWDRYDEVWTVERVGEQRSRVWRSNGSTQRHVQAPELENKHVSALKVARDGVRVAVVADDGLAQRVYVGAIDRDGGRIDGLLPLDATASGVEVVDIAWQDAQTLLVLTRDNKQNRELTAWDVTDGTQLTSAGLKADSRIRTITAAPNGRLLAGTGDDGEILMWDPDKKKEWMATAMRGADTPAFPLS
ncbi:lipoprotein LpqB [Thermopolyspora flexuosa]|uniref:Sporulation and spore germination protein n=1 Tax=Thermopolyspora flexuosa TaxID=103836 RepID=A0A543J204_9ACTN|nr:LpqB family beta-propeller domain-containing protein [Thermopolyspora flexuosa]TQM76822.1 sporulation and spore germination protein [Thermopolyspora flexuosa]GGM87014.1 lipoprotein LpqB [Thermopolyspora flexuosa]